MPTLVTTLFILTKRVLSAGVINPTQFSAPVFMVTVATVLALVLLELRRSARSLAEGFVREI